MKKNVFIKRFSNNIETNVGVKDFKSLNGVRLSVWYDTDVGELEIYDIDDTSEAQRYICKWMRKNGFKAPIFKGNNGVNYWDVFEYDEDGNPTEYADEEWNEHYDIRDYRIALLNNKICGMFFVDDEYSDGVWIDTENNMYDYSSIPLEREVVDISGMTIGEFIEGSTESRKYFFAKDDIGAFGLLRDDAVGVSGKITRMVIFNEDVEEIFSIFESIDKSKFECQYNGSSISVELNVFRELGWIKTLVYINNIVIDDKKSIEFFRNGDTINIYNKASTGEDERVWIQRRDIGEDTVVLYKNNKPVLGVSNDGDFRIDNDMGEEHVVTHINGVDGTVRTSVFKNEDTYSPVETEGDVVSEEDKIIIRWASKFADNEITLNDIIEMDTLAPIV